MVLAAAGYYCNCAPLAYDTLLDESTVAQYVELLNSTLAHRFARAQLLALARLLPRPRVGAMQFVEIDGDAELTTRNSDGRHALDSVRSLDFDLIGGQEFVNDRVANEIKDALSTVCNSYLAPFLEAPSEGR